MLMIYMLLNLTKAYIYFSLSDKVEVIEILKKH